MNRSQTDSNLSCHHEDLPEATGSSRFVNKEGGFNFQVILESIHSVTMRGEVCSVRVCETSLSILELLLDLGVGINKEEGGSEDDPSSGSNNSHSICIDIVARFNSYFYILKKIVNLNF